MVSPIDPEKYAASGTEDAQQIALFMWAANPIVRKQYPELKYLFAIPNGGTRDKREAGKLKAAGVKAGVPDTCLPVRRGEYSGLWIEVKRPKTQGKASGKSSVEQDDWIVYLRSQGYGAVVCVGFVQARNMIIEYLNYGK